MGRYAGILFSVPACRNHFDGTYDDPMGGQSVTDFKPGQLFLNGNKHPDDPAIMWELIEVLPEYNSYRFMERNSDDPRPWSNTMRAAAFDYCISRDLMIPIGMSRTGLEEDCNATASVLQQGMGVPDSSGAKGQSRQGVKVSRVREDVAL